MTTDERPPQVVLGRLIRAARWTLGWRQSELAEALGLSVATVSAIEQGDRKRYSREELVRYEEVLGITDSRLLTAMGFLPQEVPAPAKPGRRSLSYGGQPLTDEQEQQVIDYIDWVRSRDQAG